ncbi:helix-turn-helix domain-containing protein [uncultured Ligilactobacillus sp.]|uniref:helix-turn-helix domain-containing protein n=1 Tax=uncultured Ligilactobacillus sp. TaxID=2837633 RepID=UPI00272C4175|nr:helix-turn-helix domain-containing protein [uncultured Ligilactobacillus sp.]
MTKLDDILQLYSTAEVSERPELTPESVSFICEKGYLNLTNVDLTDRELELLRVLLGEPVKHYDRWQAFLCGKGEKPSIEGKVRFILGKVELKNSEFSLTTWKKALREMFMTEILACFQLKNDEFVLVERVGPTSYESVDFLGIAQSLDAELNTKTKFFIGDPWPTELDLAQLFTEEQAMFERSTDKNTTVMTATKGALEYFTHQSRKQSYLLKSYQRLFLKDPQLKKIIQALYHTQGNTSLAAKKLYLHRNSLQYKLNRFAAESGLDVKKMDDLMFCYLLTL